MSIYDTATQEGIDAGQTDFGCPLDACDCWDDDAEFPCWPCYRDRFDIPNPSPSLINGRDSVGEKERSQTRTL